MQATQQAQGTPSGCGLPRHLQLGDVMIQLANGANEGRLLCRQPVLRLLSQPRLQNRGTTLLRLAPQGPHILLAACARPPTASTCSCGWHGTTSEMDTGGMMMPAEPSGSWQMLAEVSAPEHCSLGSSPGPQRHTSQHLELHICTATASHHWLPRPATKQELPKPLSLAFHLAWIRHWPTSCCSAPLPA